MSDELRALRAISDGLEACQLQFMLTGSFAMAFYSLPRMTRDLDLVVALRDEDVPPLVSKLSPDFYIDPEDARAAIQSERLFNLMHNETGVKVDLIVRKSSEYRQTEFARRKLVNMAGVRTWITSREDLILSKLVWAMETNSELQRRDVKNLIDDDVDRAYLYHWAERLKVVQLLSEILA